MNKKTAAAPGTFQKIVGYIRKGWWLFGASLLLAAVSVVATLYIPVLVGKCIDSMLGPGMVKFQVISSLLLRIGVLIGVVSLPQWLMQVCSQKLTYRVIARVRNDAFQKLQVLPLAYLDRHQPGELVSRMIADVDQFADGLLLGFTQLFSGIVTIAGTLLFMISINAYITLVVVLVTPISLLVAKFIATKTYSMFQELSIIRGQQTALTEELIGNQKVVQAFSMEQKTMARFDTINRKLETCTHRALFFSSLTNPCTRFVNSLVYTGVGLAGALAAVNGAITVGGLSCFLSYANQYTKPFNEVSGVITELQNAFACAERVFQLMEQKPEVPDKQNAAVLEAPDCQVDLEHVSFSYQPDRPLIEELCLRVMPGQRVAIVGPTGSGKTTLINLLMRFYDVNAGSIQLDHMDLRDLKRQSLRSNIGMVLQDTWLRDGTIAENIAIGNPKADQDAIIRAAKESYAHSFIQQLPQGYDTVMTHNGSNLSQGQRQLLCIARIMLRTPSILILDEATSSIDTRTEVKIQAAFRKLMENRTSFIVAHRLSTIREADCILVMNQGKVVEMGTHRELLSAGGVYAAMYMSQFKH